MSFLLNLFSAPTGVLRAARRRRAAGIGREARPDHNRSRQTA